MSNNQLQTKIETSIHCVKQIPEDKNFLVLHKL